MASQTPLSINAAVLHEAGLRTDGRLTPELLADTAASLGLPLYSPAPGSLADLEAGLAHARGMLAQHRLGYAAACANLGVANRSTWEGTPLSREAVRNRRSLAMRRINKERGWVRHFTAKLAQAEAALAAIRTPAWAPSLAMAA